LRIVVALGGNALLRRGQPMTAQAQRENVRIAAQQLAPIAEGNELVISHGNGPQVGLLSLQAAAYHEVEEYPLDVLGAQTEGMIGYIIEQELGNLLPIDRPFASILTMVEVDPADPAFAQPTKFIGPVYERDEAERLAAAKGWSIKADGAHWRRVVASPDPLRIFEIRPIRWLLERGCVVICTGGGGIPTMFLPGTNTLVGAEVVIDKDRASALLAEQLEADLFVMATDVEAVYRDFGTPQAAPIGRTTPSELEALSLPTGSMGPKVEAAMSFVRRTGRRAVIGTLAQLTGVVAGEQGTIVEPDGPAGRREMRQAGTQPG
jgi:carbamate kinase